jgi:hypothetical protein
MKFWKQRTLTDLDGEPSSKFIKKEVPLKVFDDDLYLEPVPSRSQSAVPSISVSRRKTGDQTTKSLISGGGQGSNPPQITPGKPGKYPRGSRRSSRGVHKPTPEKMSEKKTTTRGSQSNTGTKTYTFTDFEKTKKATTKAQLTIPDGEVQLENVIKENSPKERTWDPVGSDPELDSGKRKKDNQIIDFRRASRLRQKQDDDITETGEFTFTD